MTGAVDISHLYGSDVGVTPSGDLATVFGAPLTIQRIIRRLLTTETVIGNSAYPWEPNYGCGLSAKIGGPFDRQAVQALVLSQMLQEASVAPLPAPQVQVSEVPGGGAVIGVIYTDRSGNLQSFNFDLSP